MPFALGRDDEAEDLFLSALPAGTSPGEAPQCGRVTRLYPRGAGSAPQPWPGALVRRQREQRRQAPNGDIPAFGNLVFEVDQRPVGAWVASTGANLCWRQAVEEDGLVLVETTK